MPVFQYQPSVGGSLEVEFDMESRCYHIAPFLFHPGLENNMADDASSWFDLPDLVFLTFFVAHYSPVQLSGSWTACRPHT